VGDLRKLVSLQSRFSAMVLAGTRWFSVTHITGRDGAVAFIVRNMHGRNAISEGVAVFQQH